MARERAERVTRSLAASEAHARLDVSPFQPRTFVAPPLALAGII